MNSTSLRIALLIPLATVGGLLWALPFIMRRGLLFGVPVPEGFRKQPEAKRAIHEYLAGVGLAMLLAAAITVWVPSASGSKPLAAPVILMASAALLHYREYRRLKPFAVQPVKRATASLSVSDDLLPKWAWLGAVPFILLAATALYTQQHYAELPARWPRHWGIDGKPNGWGERTFKGVYGPLAFGALVLFYLTGVGAAIWYGARRRGMRVLTLKILLAVSLLMGVVFAMVGLAPFVKQAPPMGVTMLLIFAPIVLIIIWSARANQTVDEEPVESTPNECWYGGMFYYNPNDAALFVEKRDGFGMTMNFGNTWAWLLMAVPLLIPFGAMLLIG